MQAGPDNRVRAAVSLGLILTIAMLGLGLRDSRWRPGERFLSTSYDSLHSLSGQREGMDRKSPIVLVYLDLPTFRQANHDPAQPWPREIHASLVRRLKAAGARAIVFDIVFSHAGPSSAADRELARAIEEQGRVILAAEYNNKSTIATDETHDRARIGTSESVYEPLARSAAGVGFASLAIDRDRSVRHFVAGFTDDSQPALAWAAARMLDLPVTRNADAMRSANQHWIRYYGPPLTLPHTSYHQALETNGTRDDFFRDRIVFVGSRPLVGAFNDRQDEFGNPFDFWRNKELFMPGVEVHATQLLNLFNQDWLRRLPQSGEIALLLLVAVFGGVLVWFRPVIATASAAAGLVVTLGFALAGFAHGVWFPWLIVAGAQLPAALGGSVLYASVEWYRARKRFEAEKKLADAKIREQAALLDKAHDAILVQDLAGNCLYANPSAQKLYGWSLAELQAGKALSELQTPEAAAAASARAATLARGEWNGELLQRSKTGAFVTVASRWTLIRDEAGSPKALLTINSDITEKKALEQQFLRTQRLNTIGTLAGGMAHDLNNALAPVLLGTQLLRRKTEDAESRDLLALIETSTHRGAEMVRQVLLFARGRGGEFEPLTLSTLLKDLEQMVRETFPKNIVVEKFLPPDLWPVRGNVTQLHQVLLNLCVNARDAMPDGGKLSLAADNVELSATEAAGIPEGRAGEFVSLLVADSGTGIPPEVRARIFEPFFTTKGEGRGTGIGLATVRRIVKAHAGFMRVESAPGEGTTFEVFLPRATEAQPVAPLVAAEIPAGQGELILVVDDEQAVRQLVSDGLTTHGFRALTAGAAADAVELFRQHREEVRLLLTDSAMPHGNGAELITAVRRERPGLPVILASAEAEPGIATELPHVVLLRKPFALDELLQTVTRELRR